jgi:hypothetical protein
VQWLYEGGGSVSLCDSDGKMKEKPTGKVLGVLLKKLDKMNDAHETYNKKGGAKYPPLKCPHMNHAVFVLVCTAGP